MKTRYAILGSGRQGTSAAYDIARFGGADEIRLYDIDLKTAERAAEKINSLLATRVARGLQLDVRNPQQLRQALQGIHATVSAVPYHFNLAITQAAIHCQFNLCDLGGHTDTVRQQLALHDEALKVGVTLTPDCGMGPGLNISMAVRAMDAIEQPEELRIWDGGLPLDPKPPWHYLSTFHINGLTNEYCGDAWFIRDGKPTPVPCLTELETLNFAEPLGPLEAAVTSGGLSTAPWTFAGQLQRLENKTLRYPGHWQMFQAYQQLGLFELDPITVDGKTVIPRDVFHALLEPQITNADPAQDICVIRTTCKGLTNGSPAECTLQLIETYDEKTGFTAMEKLTGWHAAIIAILGAQGKLAKGALPVEKALVGKTFDTEVAKRGWKFVKS
ncbi:MAG: hypothetical protein E2O44_02255 [Nitrospina sp.]|nr:MAG: hypothetical protein E2O44_02255 [Nitrospina sp.]